MDRKGAPIDLTTPKDSETESDILDDGSDKRCVCDKYEPGELVNHDEVYFTNIEECDSCGHLAHMLSVLRQWFCC